MYCSSCGGELEPDANFCEHCGAEVGEVEAAAPAQGHGSPPDTGAGETSTGSAEPTTTQGVQPETDRAPRDETTQPRERGREHERGDNVAGGLDSNVAGALSYLLGFVTGLIFFLIEEEDEFVRFHAAQSMVVFGGLVVVSIVVNVFTGFLGATGFFMGLFGLFFSLIWMVISVGALVLWIYLMVKAYQGETPRIPIAADIADDLV